MDRDKSGKSGISRELCDWCGTVISDGTEIHGLAPDSSMIHASIPGFDGRRFLTACNHEHLVALYEHYRRRPFVDEELWAGKIARALNGTAEELTIEDLTDATGLSREQVERCMAWLEAQLHRPRDR
ncbi:hypothetical protein AB0B45_22865 [Nonomuraea sp. NPDC049152]|uniref:hypothetical protein n=1 Tax=Nonomuraea sp. NPDC049152 TaxID=3154350 RepID=UPI0033CD166F